MGDSRQRSQRLAADARYRVFHARAIGAGASFAAGNSSRPLEMRLEATASSAATLRGDGALFGSYADGVVSDHAA